MNENELRIGNWVQIDNEYWPNLKGVKYQVTSIEGNDSVPYQFRGLGFCQFDYNIQPIQLTEEWLLKFGFERRQIKDLISYTLPKLELYQYSSNNNKIFFEYADGEIQLRYVHQLQNLYFALTGEELTYGGGE